MSLSLRPLRVVAATGLALAMLGGPGPGAVLAQAPAVTVPAPKLDVPYVPTPDEVVARMLDMAKVQPGEFVIDLGSGDGRIAIAAAKRGARALGVDLNPVRVQESVENARKEGVSDRVTFREQNLFDTDIAPADVLTMYLLQSVNMQLRPRILNELRPGTRVVSHAFHFADWEPDQQATVDGRQVFFWVVPAKVEGRWALRQGDRTIDLDLRQEFQRVSGTAEVDGRSVPIREGRLDGADIRLTLADGQTFTGRVDGRRIVAAGEGGWTAEPRG